MIVPAGTRTTFTLQTRDKFKNPTTSGHVCVCLCEFVRARCEVRVRFDGLIHRVPRGRGLVAFYVVAPRCAARSAGVRLGEAACGPVRRIVRVRLRAPVRARVRAFPRARACASACLRARVRERAWVMCVRARACKCVCARRTSCRRTLWQSNQALPRLH